MSENQRLLRYGRFSCYPYSRCPALSKSNRTGLLVDIGQDVKAQSTCLHDPLTLVLWIFGCGDT
jgi:hypothetical protein